MILENAFIKISKYLKEYDYSISSMSNSPIKNASNEHISTTDMYCNNIIVNDIENIPYSYRLLNISNIQQYIITISISNGSTYSLNAFIFGMDPALGKSVFWKMLL